MTTRGSGPRKSTGRRKTATRRRKGTRPPHSSFGGLLERIRQETRELSEEMTFEQYLERIRKDPRPGRLAHQLIHDMIAEAGVGTTPLGEPKYFLFEDEVFGADDVLRQIVEYFAAAAKRLDVRRRILLLVGPPGSGKSTVVNAIKERLEDYTRTPEGAIYAIKGCPVQEEPLHLIPKHLRAELDGPWVEGELCPYCRWLVRDVYKGDVARVPVERVTMSIGEGVGIGTFVATDPRSEDLTRLVGRVDTTLLKGTDREAARRAFRLDGELNAANRGIADLIEIFKMDERFLAVLLTLSQEQFIKISGPMTMYADEAIVAHSNLAEYEAMVNDPRAAALQDRLVVVRVRYVLSVRDEIRIYEKMLGGAAPGINVSPLALPAAAALAVLTRLAKPRRSGWDLRKKLHLYDSRYVRDADPEDLQALRAETPDEGLTGVSPRFVINQLSNEAGRTEGCLSGARLLDTMWRGLRQRAAFREDEREEWEELFAIAREEYDELVRRTIRRALVAGFRESADAQARDVLGDLRRWADGHEDEFRLTALRSVERTLGLPQYRIQPFRESLLLALEDAEDRGEEHLSTVDPRLEEALERDLLPDWRQVARTLLSERDGPARGGLRERLEEEGFKGECAEDLLEHAGRLASVHSARRRGWGFGGSDA